MPPEQNQNPLQSNTPGQEPTIQPASVNDVYSQYQQFKVPEPQPPQLPVNPLPQSALPTTPPESANTPHKKASKTKAIVIALLVLIVVVVLLVVGAMWYMSKHKTVKSTVSDAVPTQAAAKSLCSQFGAAILCQNISDGMTTKYTLPASIGEPYTILPSPDESKVFIDTPSNPSDPTITDNFYITDNTLTTQSQLPSEKSNEDYNGFAWTANSQSIIFAKRQVGANQQFGPDSLYMYNTTTKTTQTILMGTAQYNLSNPTVSTDGTMVFAENGFSSSGGKLNLAAVSLSNDTPESIDVGAVTQIELTTSDYMYDRVNNLFYIEGSSAATGKSIMVIAELVNANGSLQMTPLKTIDDGYTYTPLAGVEGGVIVQRTLTPTTQYGILKTDGSFTALTIHPSQNAIFALSDTLSLTPDTSSSLSADDFLTGFVTPTASLKTFLQKLVTQNCPANTYNSIVLNAQTTDGTQASVSSTPCADGQSASGNGMTAYYVSQGGTYKEVYESQQGVSCPTQKALNLSKQVVPTCSTTGS